MANLGFTTPAPSSGPIGTASGALKLTRVGPVPVGGGTLISVSSFSKTGNAIGVVYNDIGAGAGPGTLLAQTAPYAGGFVDTWNTANTTTTPALVAGSYYWVGQQIQSDSSTFYYREQPGTNNVILSSSTYGTPPSTMVGSGYGFYSDNDLGDYRTYSAGVATRSTSITLVDGSNAAVASTSIDWYLTSTWAGTVAASGTTSTNASGVLLITGLTPAAGSYKLFVKQASDENFYAMRPVTLV